MCTRFAHTNPLHPDVFPSIPRFVKSWFYEGYPRNNCSRNVIFWPSFLFRIFYSIQLNIQRTQKYWGSMRLTCEAYCVLLLVGRVIPQSAHLHMTRQHSTFKIKLRRAQVAANFRADVKAMKRLVNKNTVMVPLFLWCYWCQVTSFNPSIITEVLDLANLFSMICICYCFNVLDDLWLWAVLNDYKTPTTGIRSWVPCWPPSDQFWTTAGSIPYSTSCLMVKQLTIIVEKW